MNITAMSAAATHAAGTSRNGFDCRARRAPSAIDTSMLVSAGIRRARRFKAPGGFGIQQVGTGEWWCSSGHSAALTSARLDEREVSMRSRSSSVSAHTRVPWARA